MKSIGHTLLGSIAISLCLSGPSRAFFTPEMIDPDLSRTRLATASENSGPIAPAAPLQADLDRQFSIPWGDFEITARQGIGIEAVVLSKKAYRQGDLGYLVPFDLALAWGKMSDPLWIRHLRVSQGERLYRWSFPAGIPLDVETVISNSANMHFIPVNTDVRDRLADVRRGDVVRLSGFLVDISGPGDFSWKTSLVRDDVGRGSCELILLETIEILRE